MLCQDRRFSDSTYSTMFVVFKDKWAYLFNSDPRVYLSVFRIRTVSLIQCIEVVSLVASILPLVALFQVFDGNAAVTAGILRARGKQVSSATLIPQGVQKIDCGLGYGSVVESYLVLCYR